MRRFTTVYGTHILTGQLSGIDCCFTVEFGVLLPPIMGMSADWWFVVTQKYSSLADSSATPHSHVVLSGEFTSVVVSTCSCSR